MSIHLLACGCDYRGETFALPDCAMDAENLAAALEPYIASGIELVNEHSDRTGMLKALAKLKSRMKSSDLAIVSFSGHGTSDFINGKEVQGIVANDATIIYEFELRKLLADLGQAVFIADCCFSGGLVRSGVTAKQLRRQRWIPATHCFHRKGVEVPSRQPPKPHVTYMACKAGETAASTGKGGAFTRALLEAFEAQHDKTTLRGLHEAIRTLLPNEEYDQHPQFYCRDATFAKRTIKSFKKTWNKRARVSDARPYQNKTN